MIPDSTSKPDGNVPIEAWMLTAYALRELSETETAQVEQALAHSPQLREELQSIETTLGRVKEAFDYSSGGDGAELPSLSSSQQERVKQAIAEAEAGSLLGETLGRGPGVSPEIPSTTYVPFYRKKSFAALLAALAASLLLVWLVRPIGMNEPNGLSWQTRDTEELVEHNAPPPPTSSMPTLTTNGQTEKAVERRNIKDIRLEQHNQGGASPARAMQGMGPQSGQLWGEIDKEREGVAVVEDAIELSFGGNSPQLPKSSPAAAPALQPLDASSMEGRETGGSMLGGGSQPMGMGGGMSIGGMGGMGELKSESEALNRGLQSSTPLSIAPSDVTVEQIPLHRYPGGMPEGALPPELRNNFVRPPIVPVEPPSGDRFEAIVEKPFQNASEQPVTTFSIDVDTAAYSKIRQSIQQLGRLPSPDMVRIEEMINYFSYNYEAPTGDTPFAASLMLAPCPWNASHKIVRVGIQAKKVAEEERPRCNLVFLIDVSGSMDAPNKLPLVQRSISMLTDRLHEEDRVAIVVYAGAAGCVLESTPGSEKERIRSAIYNLRASGSTHGSAGIQLAYSIAKNNFVSGGSNRVILCTDGDFNVGVTNDDALVELVKERAKENIFLTCVGFGQGNYNDRLMERISRDGNGVYGMVDSDREAKKLMVDELSGTLVTVAKDVKVQMDFNPTLVRAYRLIGYENRHLKNADFNNDKKDAGDIGAGHSVTAIYEVVPASLREPNLTESGSESKYKSAPLAEEATVKRPDAEPLSNEWLTLKLRYKEPEASESTKLEFVLQNPPDSELAEGDRDLQWATSVAEFGLLLRKSKMAPNADWDKMIERAATSSSGDEHRTECVGLMRTAKGMQGR